MKKIADYILKLILSEIFAIFMFGGAYLISSFLPTDEISYKIRGGILFLWSISAISLPFIIRYLRK